MGLQSAFTAVKDTAQGILSSNAGRKIAGSFGVAAGATILTFDLSKALSGDFSAISGEGLAFSTGLITSSLVALGLRKAKPAAAIILPTPQIKG